MQQRSTQRTRKINKGEKSNTIFNEVWQFAYVLGARGRDFIDSTIKTSFSLHTIHGGSTSLFITRESQGFRKPQLNSTSNQKRSPNPSRRTDSPVGRPAPVLQSTGRSTGTNRNPMSASWSTASVNCSPCRPGYACARCARRSTGRLADPCPGLLRTTFSFPLNSNLYSISSNEFKKLSRCILSPLSP